jgi:xanthine dehydrogenase accessory factor
VELFSDIAKLVEEGRPFVLATVIDSSGSTPQKPGSKMVVLDGGETRGTVGGGAIEQQIVEAARALLADGTQTSKLVETHLTHDLGMCCGGRMRVFLEKHGAAAHLYVFGAGHVAKELAALAHRVGFRVHVTDARAGQASQERFPDAAELKLEDPADVARALPGGPDCYFCITTHDHPLDQACVEALLRKPAAYIGVIGSRRKAERFKMRLRAAGFTDAELERMRSPMGVNIGALTPAEIAVSIVGELISVRRGNRSRKASSVEQRDEDVRDGVVVEIRRPAD